MVSPRGDLARYRFGAARADVLVALRAAAPALGTFMLLCGWTTTGFFLCNPDGPAFLILDGVLLATVAVVTGLVSVRRSGPFAVALDSVADAGPGFIDS